MRPHESHWRALLANALGRVLRKTVSAEDAATELRRLDDRHLSALDQAMRPAFWAQDFLHRPPAILAGSPNEDIEACFFAAGCAGSGFLRQRSLAALRNFPGRLTLALALIRCDDWVAPVRDEAHTLLRTLIQTRAETPSELFELFDLLIALRSRQRIGAEAWPQTILPALRHPDLADLRRQATTRGSARARLFAYALIAEVDGPEQVSAAKLRAIYNADPAIARWAIDACATDWAQDIVILERGLHHPHASVRARALRRYAQLSLPRGREHILAALVDPARSPRAVAAFLARTMLNLDPRRYWREALDAGEGRVATLIQSLADCAEAEDAQRLRPWLDHPSGTVRAAALRGYARTGAADLQTRLGAALHDRSTRVLRQLLELSRHHPGVLTRDTLDAAYREAPNPAAATRLIGALALLDQWSSLELLLRWLAEVDGAHPHGDPARDGIPRIGPRAERIAPHADPRMHLLLGGIDAWLGAQSRRFNRLKEDDRPRLEAALGRIRTSTLSWRHAQLAHTLKHA